MCIIAGLRWNEKRHSQGKTVDWGNMKPGSGCPRQWVHISLKVISGAGTALVLVGDGEFLPFARTIHPQQISTFRQPRKKLAFATAGPLSAGGSYDLGAQI